jgi:hypothetical protein
VVGKVKHMLERDGRYYSRLVVPLAARPFLGGKIELRTPLGADYKAAVKSHFVAIADMMLVIQQAEAKAVMQGAKIAQPAKYRLTINQIAQINYQQRLTQDAEGRVTLHYAQIGIDELFVTSLRSGMSGKASDAELEDLVGHRIHHFVQQGNTHAKFGTDAWRTLAMSLCASEYEALERVYERDEGDFSGEPVHPVLANAQPLAVPLPPVSLFRLFEDYIASRLCCTNAVRVSSRDCWRLRIPKSVAE